MATPSEIRPSGPAAGIAKPFILQGSDRFGRMGRIHSVYNPADNATLVGECHLAEPLHVELIERAAEEGFKNYRHSRPEVRAAILERLGALIEAHQADLARLITGESGKPITQSRKEVERSIALARAYAAEALRTGGRLLSLDGRDVRIRHFPLGPVLAITPYNFPLNLVMHKLCPAIAAGCSITVKPSLKTPITALYLGRLAVEAGYEAISVVPADDEVSEKLVCSESFAKLSFTGSAVVGWHLKAIAGRKSVTLELGGNAAVIVDDVVGDLQEMARRIAFGAFAFAGQTCISVQRILVSEAVKDTFVPALVLATREMKVGDPMRNDTAIGPMITIRDVQRSRSLIKDALRAGANVVYGGNTYNALTMNPTLLDRTTSEMAVNAEEVFAPIATIVTYENFEEALAMANRSRYGLQTGVYTRSISRAERAFQVLEAGGVVVNDIPGYRSDLLPYGGVKDSGLGREGVLSGIAEYSHTKTLIMRMDLESQD